MRILNKLSINQRIQLVVGVILLFLFAVSGYTIYTLSAKKIEKSINQQMSVYLDNLASIIFEVDQQGDPGFSVNDYNALKKYFNKPAYFSTDYPFMADASGFYTLHLYKEGQRFPKELLNKIYVNSEREGSFEFSEKINNQEQKIKLFFKRIDSFNAIIGVPVNLKEASSELNFNRFALVLLVVLAPVLLIFIIIRTLQPTLKIISIIDKNVSQLARGETPPSIACQTHDEVGKIVNTLNVLTEGLSSTTRFANEIGQNNLNTVFNPLGANDRLGNALLDMRQSLKHALDEDERRRAEDQQRNWINSGLATFADILRQNNNNLHLLSDTVTQNLLNYLDANQGGLFIINEDNEEEPFLELVSAFAFNRKKSKQKNVMLGEGLVGNCAIEKQTVYLKEIPADYIKITSGLGDASPRSLLITPLKLEDKVFGVIEIASFNEFKPFEIDFIEKVGESIASTLSAVKNNIRTSQLLEQSQQQREEMAAQEEEMRQNMEEMQATQEEMARKTIEIEGMSAAINEGMLFGELTENGSFTNLNSNLLNTIGYTKTEVEGKTIQNLIYPTEVESFNEIWKSIKAGATHKGAIRWINRINEEIYILSSMSPAFDETGDLYRIFFLGQDITASKQVEIKAQEQAEEIEQNLMEIQAEQELALQREEEISALLKALDKTCLLTEVNPEGRITYINTKNEEVLGSKKEEIEGKLHHEIDFLAKQNPEKYNAFWKALLEGNPQQREFSLTVNNRKVWIAEHYTPIIGRDGHVEKIINIGIDISISKNTEISLQHQVEELNKQLKRK